MRWLDSITNSVDMDLSKVQKILEDRGAWPAAVHGVAERSEEHTSELLAVQAYYVTDLEVEI